MQIEIQNVSKIIDKNIILKNINMKIESGKIYGFIGRNGSGKTMLLKMICGFVKPTDGKIIINNQDIFSKNYFTNDIRALIEHPKFLGNITGYENLKLLANINNTITDEDILKWLDILNMSEEKDKIYNKYSLGMKQKLGLIQVLMENPKIIILDEPFNALDEESLNKIRHILKEEKEKDKIIIIATHIKEDIEKLCDTIYHFANGHVSLK